MRSYYPPATEVPRDTVAIMSGYSEESDLETTVDLMRDKLIEGQVSSGIDSFHNNYYHRELPSTSLSYRTPQSLFPSLHHAKVTQLTGWRNLNTSNNGYLLRYHYGVDLSRVGVFDPVPAIGAGDALSYWNDPAGEPGDSAIDGDTKNAVFLAPEDGIFYLWRSKDWDSPQNLPIYSGSGIKTGNLYGYSSHTYGWIGALSDQTE